MRRYRFLPMVGPLLGVALGVLTELLVRDQVFGHNSLANPASVLLGLLIIVGFAELLRGVFERYLAETNWLRAIVIGPNKVEGLWIDRVVDVKTGEESYGIVDIEPAGYGVTYGGRNYKRTGEYQGNFASLVSHLHGEILDYTYFGVGAANLSRFGVGHVDFWYRRNFVGQFFDTESRAWYGVTGRRIEGEDVKRLAERPYAKTVETLINRYFFPEEDVESRGGKALTDTRGS